MIGVVVGGAGGERRIGARKGVVLACGGFEWNADMVKTYIGYEVKPLTPVVEHRRRPPDGDGGRRQDGLA